jgi:hypothetical protein
VGYTMITDKLFYTESTRVIESGSPVFVKGEGILMSGAHLIIHIDDQKVELDGDVKSTLWNTKVLEQAKGQIN